MGILQNISMRKGAALKDRIITTLTIAVTVTVGAALWYRGSGYYLLSVEQRVDAPLHALLAPAHPVGHLLGWLGLGLMTVMLLYSVRKRVRWMRRLGSLRHWLSSHILMGLLGPLLITFHSAFKVSGLVSIAYWSMIVTMVSGIFGRYIYVQIPNSVLGDGQSPAALAEEARSIEVELERSVSSASDLVAAPRPDGARGGWQALLVLLADDLKRPWRRLRLALALRRAGLPRGEARAAVRLVQRRDLILRRIDLSASLSEVFRYWHALHKPFVYIMFLIAAVHVGVALLFGYAGL